MTSQPLIILIQRSLRSSLRNSIVIPGKPAIPPKDGSAKAEASATRNLPPLRLPFSKGGRYSGGVLDARFREHDGRETLISFANFSSRILESNDAIALAYSAS